jgi:hypothetical protein
MIFSETLKKYLPFRVRNTVTRAAQRYSFHHALRRIAALAPREIPSRDLLEYLRAGWGNEAWSPRAEYLEEVVRWAAMTPGPVLECGSGLTTILLGLFAGRRGIPVWTLEHDVEWYERTLIALRKYRISGIELCLAPLRDHGSFTWYEPPLDYMPVRFQLVVCDGPPKINTPGDRYGLLPVMREYLCANTVILLDDVNAYSEDAVLSRWLIERPATGKILKDEGSHSFALIVLD